MKKPVAKGVVKEKQGKNQLFEGAACKQCNKTNFCAIMIPKTQTKVSSSVLGKHQEEMRLKHPVKALIR